MEAKLLHGELRKDTSKGMTKNLRREGKIPAVIYGHTEPTPIAVNAHEFRTTFRRVTGNTIIQLTLPEGSHDVLVKDHQRSILSGEILHIDFYEFKSDVALRTRVPVRLEGNSVGVREGGVLETLIHTLDVECLPKDLPEVLVAEVSGLMIGHSFKVGDLPAYAGVKIHHPADQVICTVTHKMAEEVVVAAAVEEAATEEGAEKAEGAEETEEKKDSEE